MRLLYFLILVLFCACDDSFPYDWTIKTVEHGSDFTNNFKPGGKFLQLSDKTINDDDYCYDKASYKKLDKYVWRSDDANIDKNYAFDEKPLVYPYNEKLYTKNENDGKLKTNLILLQNNKDVKHNKNINNNERYTGANNYGDNEQGDYIELSLNLKNNLYKEVPKLNHHNYNTPHKHHKDDDERLQNTYKEQYGDNNKHDFNILYEHHYDERIQNANKDQYDDNSKHNYNILHEHHDNDEGLQNANKDQCDHNEKHDHKIPYEQHDEERLQNANKDQCDHNEKHDHKIPYEQHDEERLQNANKDQYDHNEKHDHKISYEQHDEERLQNANKDQCDHNEKHDHKIPNEQHDEEQNANKDQYNDKNNHLHTITNNNNSSGDKDIEDNNQKENLVIATECSGKYEDIENFVGTNLLDNTIKRCFSTEEVVLLVTRRDFENLIPKDLPQSLFNDRMVEALLNYFYICHQIIIDETSDNLISLTLKAFYDALGGYLNYYMVPVAKYSYYAGHIGLDTVQKVIILHQQCKAILNTNGNGWKAPIQNVLVELKSVQIEPLNIPSTNKYKVEDQACIHLDMETEEYQSHNEKMIIQIPQLETEDFNGFLGNVWLPFKRKKIYDLKADSSAYIIVKFYESVTKCYRHKNIDQSVYNSEFKSWLLENIHPHLSDEQLYPGFGAVLRIYEYLKRCKKDAKTYKENKIDQQMKPIYRNNKYNRPKTLDNKGKLLIDYELSKPNITNHKLYNIQKNITGLSRKNNTILKGTTVDQNQQFIKTPADSTHLKAADDKDFTNTKVNLRALELTPPEIAIIAVPVVILIILIICCYKTFCKKKPLPPTKHSSSSSSNLFNSPVRFFHLRPKSASDYSSTDAGSKKGKKSVKIKKSALTSDTSASSSPVRKNPKGKLKDSSKK